MIFSLWLKQWLVMAGKYGMTYHGFFPRMDTEKGRLTPIEN
jgi:hypothetical protein